MIKLVDYNRNVRCTFCLKCKSGLEFDLFKDVNYYPDNIGSEFSVTCPKCSTHRSVNYIVYSLKEEDRNKIIIKY